MNRFKRMNATAQIYMVMISASSIDPQFEAIGVIHHGLNQWNRIDPITSSAMPIATYIGAAPRAVARLVASPAGPATATNTNRERRHASGTARAGPVTGR